jgi:hypothetical protein
MRHIKASFSVALFLAITAAWAPAQPVSLIAARTSLYLGPDALPFDLILPPPPAKNSPIASQSVHYASDIKASRHIAYALFGALATSPQFQKDLAAARAETRQRLGQPAAINS